MKHLVIIIYESVKNSNLDGEYREQLLNRLDLEPHLHITIISYQESSTASADILKDFTHPRLSLHLLSKHSLLGSLSIWLSAWHLAKLLPRTNPYELIAEGTLAGYLSLQVYDPLICTKFTIRAHEFLNPIEDLAARNIARLWHNFRVQSLQKIEHTVFSNPAPLIEVNNAATRDYIHAHYGARLERISIKKQTL